MITQLRLKFGSKSGGPPLNIDTTAITVFVGPNNSGKSLLLSELIQVSVRGEFDPRFSIIEGITAAPVRDDQIDNEVRLFEVPPNPNEMAVAGDIFVQSPHGRYRISLQQIRSIFRDPQGSFQNYCTFYLAPRTLMLSGPNRTQLVGPYPGGSLQQRFFQNSFQYLFRNNDRRTEVREILKKAFDRHFVLDPTSNLGQLAARFSHRAPENELEERGIHEAAVRFHAEAQPIENFSDGVKAFAGMIFEIYGGERKVILIDEPEAFLHPSLAMLLGQEISRGAAQTGRQIFASTHSPNFVMGCIQSGAPVNIVRLTYREGSASARLLPSDDILRLMRNPLLRSTGVLNGLFYEFVVITEGDTDRAFYQEINERLLQYKPEWGIPNCLFLNAQNKQTERIIIEPLRKLGIPAVGIVDVDILKEGGAVWTNLMRSAFVPDAIIRALASIRSTIKALFDATGRNMKREGGLDLLAGADRQAADHLIDQLEEYGIFTVRGGEIEAWLKDLGCTGHGAEWLIQMFEKLGKRRTMLALATA